MKHTLTSHIGNVLHCHGQVLLNTHRYPVKPQTVKLNFIGNTCSFLFQFCLWKNKKQLTVNSHRNYLNILSKLSRLTFIRVHIFHFNIHIRAILLYFCTKGTLWEQNRTFCSSEHLFFSVWTLPWHQIWQTSLAVWNWSDWNTYID